MRIALLGNAAALHTRRWARRLAAAGATVRVFSLEDPAGDPTFATEPGVEAPLDIVRLPAPAWPAALRYPAARAATAQAVDAFAPDVVEAHFVPNYGLLGTLVGCGPLVVAPWGADLLRFPSGPPVDAPHVVSLRQLEPLYDVATLIEALPMVHATVPELTGTIAGDGPEAGALRTQANARGVDGIVRFVGRLPHAALPALLSRAAVSVSCALSDSTSIALLETMAAGVTPIVTDLPGNREWIDDRVHGRIVPPGDAAALATAFVDTLGDAAFRHAARIAARRRVEARGDFAAVVRAALERYGGLVAHGAAA